MSNPTIIEVANSIARPGIETPTPMWLSTLKLFYGLPYGDEDIDRLVLATQRSRTWLESRATGGKPFSELWARVGRRGRKSSVTALIAIYEAMWGGHEAYLMPGEKGLIPAQSRDAAGSAVIGRFERTYLDALGIKHEPGRIGSIPLTVIDGSSFELATFPATADAPRGWPIPVYILDEFAHRPIDDGDSDLVNTDKASLAAGKPAMAQFEFPKLCGISSPLGCLGVFHESVEASLRSEDPYSLAVEGPSWIWSPSITEERTRELEKDPDIHSREYGAVPSKSEGLAFDPDDVMAMFAPRKGRFLWARPTMVIDAAESADTFAWSIVAWCEPDPTIHYKRLLVPTDSGILPDTFIGFEYDANEKRIPEPVETRPVLHVFATGGFDGAEVRRLGMRRVVDELASIARQYNAQQIIGDDRAGPYLEALFSRTNDRLGGSYGYHLNFTWAPYSGFKHDGVVLVRAWMRDRQILVVPSAGAEVMQKQLLGYRRFVSGGSQPFKYGTRSFRDDYACLLITLAVSQLRAADTNDHDPKHVDNSPTQKYRSGRHTVSGR